MSVVLGYVPTPEGEAALAHAVEEARDRDLRLVVVNTSRGDALVDQRYAQEEQLEQLTARLAGEGVKHDLVHAVRGRDAAEEILAAAEEHRADLIVIGLRRRTPVGKLLMGSTAQRVLLEARCPVLAVKAPPA
ncbi:MAG TPA: universal stress protein [Nocardioidaceae bacterium]|nr:universal stress protein [Nocardioidaceae bacterium]